MQCWMIRMVRTGCTACVGHVAGVSDCRRGGVVRCLLRMHQFVQERVNGAT